MPSDITEKLRTEINDGKKMRHDFALRKFTLITALLGLGSVSDKLLKTTTIEFSWLLYLVPIVAIAFDVGCPKKAILLHFSCSGFCPAS